MSEENLPAIIPTTDIVGKDSDIVDEFVAKGRPGFFEVNEEEAKKMFDLYLNGQTYRQISGIMRVSRPLVMYISKNVQWFDRRQEYLVELEGSKFTRIVDAKLMHQDLMLRYVAALHKKIGTQLNSYMATGDDKTLEKVNLKEMELLMKAMASLDKSIATPQAPGPLVGISMPDGGTMTRTGENTIEITPKEKSMDGMLKKFADMRRAADKK
jgi:hypothetical protein